MVTDDAEVRAAIGAERRDLAALLAGLTPEQWDAPTLCVGWRTREVVAHITMAYRYSMPQIVLGMLRARGSFNRMADRAARADAAKMSAAELSACVAENVDHDWQPPGGGYAGALSHDIIHGLDITVGLGLNRSVPVDRLEIVLGSLQPRQVEVFDVDLDGVELRAEDSNWSYGSGRPLTGATQDLLLVLCGRRLPPGHLSGPDAARLSAA